MVGLLTCSYSDLEPQLAVGIGLLGYSHVHDIGNGRQSVVVKAIADVDTILALVFFETLLEAVTGVGCNARGLFKYLSV